MTENRGVFIITSGFAHAHGQGRHGIVTCVGLFGLARLIIILIKKRRSFNKKSVMDQITLIIDLEGFQLSSGFLVRELGWCTMHGENDSQHFYSRLRYKDLSVKDRRTVNCVYRHVHGLRFESSCKEAALPQRDLEVVIRALYRGGLIAYKGGHLEKDVLDRMGLPSVNLEEWGFPKADSLWSLTGRDGQYPPGTSCGHHKEQTFKLAHCPKQETFFIFSVVTK